MKNLYLLGFAIFSCLCAEEQKEPDMAHVSETFGHIIYDNYEKLNVKLDLEKIIQGIENAAAGKQSPVTTQDCINAIRSRWGENFKILCEENLKKAEIFLASNAKKEGIVSLEDGKVQYQLISPGNGAEVKPHSSPLISCAIKQLDGPDLGSLESPEPVSLDETIRGLEIGLLGMKEGEKRIFYIHPDLAYGEKGLDMNRPNELLIFEIEVLNTTKLP
jgi:FKBP-type peptidyl-prolyl cis-trans isomerase